MSVERRASASTRCNVTAVAWSPGVLLRMTTLIGSKQSSANGQNRSGRKPSGRLILERSRSGTIFTRELMEFLVYIEIGRIEGDAEAHNTLMKAEKARAKELAKAGLLKSLWRVPGRRANWGIWVARDADELHEA